MLFFLLFRCVQRRRRCGSTFKAAAAHKNASPVLERRLGATSAAQMTTEKPNNHMDHVCDKGYVSDFHNGLVQTPIAFKKAMQIPDAKAAAGKEWETSKHQAAWDLKNVTPKSDAVQKAKVGRKICSLRILVDLCNLKHAELAKLLERTNGASCSGWTTAKTTVDTEQPSRSKELQLCKWQQQDSWMQFPDSWHGG